MLDLLYPYLRIAVVAASLLYAVLLTQLAGQATCPTKAYNLGPCWRGQIDAISVPTLAHLTICHHPDLGLGIDCGQPRPPFDK